MQFASQFSEAYAQLMAQLSAQSQPGYHQSHFAIGCYLCDGTYDTISSLIASYPSDMFTKPVQYSFPREGKIQSLVLDGSIRVGVDSKVFLKEREDVFSMFPVSRCRFRLMVELNHPLAGTEEITLAQLVQHYPTWGDYLPELGCRAPVSDRKISSAKDFCALGEYTIANFDSIMPWAAQQVHGAQNKSLMLVIPEALRFLGDLSVHNVSIKVRGLVCEYMAFWRKDRYDENVQALVEMLKTLSGR